MKTVGIVGFGSFGKFLAEKLSSHAKVLVFSHSGTRSSWEAPLAEVAAADHVILAVPLQSYEQVLTELRPLLGGETVVVDVCSVKVKPLQVLQKMLPGRPLVATHPMFGPESASVQLAGHTLVMCPEVSDAKAYEIIKNFAFKLELEVKEMSADEHDKSIAVVQGLTFFVAHTLETMGIHDEPLHTPSFARLLHLAELEQHHSQQLFETIQLGNDYAPAVRKAFLDVAEDIDKRLKDRGTLTIVTNSEEII